MYCAWCVIVSPSQLTRHAFIYMHARYILWINPIFIEQWMPIGVWIIICDPNLHSTNMRPIVRHGWYNPVGLQTMAVVPEFICIQYDGILFSMPYHRHLLPGMDAWTQPGRMTHMRVSKRRHRWFRYGLVTRLLSSFKPLSALFHHTLENNFHRTSNQLFTNIIPWIGCHFS